jgi:hypothetical protein
MALLYHTPTCGGAGNAARRSTVETVMRMPATFAAALLASLLTGCMAPPEAEDLVFAEQELVEHPDLCVIPDQPRPMPGPGSVTIQAQPKPEAERPATRTRRSPRLVPERGEEPCFGVEARGFPAISVDGRTVVASQADHLQLSTIPGTFNLQWHDVDSGITRIDPLVLEQWPEDVGGCGVVSRGIRRRARQANRELRAQKWRTMERLPVELFYPDTFDMEWYKEEFAPAERAVQLVVQHGEIIVRIAGVEVLERHPLAAGMNGMAYHVYADRESGTVALVTMGCIGDSCTCDPSFTTQVLHWQPQTFDAIDQRPCIADEDEDGAYCEPLDFGFNDDPFPWSF